MEKLETSWLVQTLTAKWNAFEQQLASSSPAEENPRQKLDKIFTFNYMGSAEFEFGAVGEAVDRLASHSELHTKIIEITVTADDREKKNAASALKWAKKRSNRNEPAEIEELRAEAQWMKAPHTVPIYILAPENVIDYAEKFVNEEARGSYGRLQEPSHFRASLLHSRYYTKFVGWFELDNGFMFLTDKTMFERTAEIFGVEIPSQPPSATTVLRDTVPPVAAATSGIAATVT